MNTLFYNHNIYFKSNKLIPFEAGLNNNIKEEIQKVDIANISKKLFKKNIFTDFKRNKIIAWCSEKVTSIFEDLNENYDLNLILPKGIYVEDFAKLNVGSQTMSGFSNLQPTILRKNSKEIIPSRVVFFNTFETLCSKITNEKKFYYNWTNINEIADNRFIKNYSGTNHFLDVFIHEFLHVAHENRLIKKFGLNDFAEKLDKLFDEKQLLLYRKKYGPIVDKICIYARNNPLDAVACDMSRLITKSLDKDTLLPISNPFLNTPYEEKLSLEKAQNKILYHFDKRKILDEKLRNFWDGNFD